jgi:HAD superfamily hydrolase (TIGR01509 family)
VPLVRLRHEHWIFDLDGTLTIAAHDFAAIRAMLGLPPGGMGILETLAAMPPERAAPLLRRLDEHEHEIACASAPAPGADALLDELRSRGARLAIFTRNSRRNVEATLEAAGLRRYFEPCGFMTRDAGPPKPQPHGILRLLEMWAAAPADAVMVGDHRMDLEAGRAAGTATVHVDPTGAFGAGEHADVQVRNLDELLRRVREDARD